MAAMTVGFKQWDNVHVIKWHQEHESTLQTNPSGYNVHSNAAFLHAA